MARKPTAVTLREGHVPHSEPVTLGVFPGVYVAGQPVLLEDLGLDPDEAADLIERYNLPLELSNATRKTAADVSDASGAVRAPSGRPGALPEEARSEDAYRSGVSPIPKELVPGSGRFGLDPEETSYEDRREATVSDEEARVTPLPAEVLRRTVEHPEQYPGGPRIGEEGAPVAEESDAAATGETEDA